MRISALFYLVCGATAFMPSVSKPFTSSKKLQSTTVDSGVNGSGTHQPPVFDDVCDTVGVTMSRFFNEISRLNPEYRELSSLFLALQTASKAISNEVKRSQLPKSNTLGYEGNINVQGEDQKKLDVITNEILKRALRFTGKMGVLASEEEDKPVDMLGDEKEVYYDEGERYVAVFDPLDGSSNVDAGIPTGTIVGIYEHEEVCELTDDFWDAPEQEMDESEMNCMANTLQPGTKLVAAAYVLYSSSTFFVLTLGNGTYGFTLDETLGEFILSHPDIKIPEHGNIVSFNESNCENWDKPLQEVASAWRKGKGRTGKTYSSRYIGSMVGDVHRTLMYGGVFGYPADTKNVNGKLRLLYEAAPMAFIMEQAGGLATTGRERIMEIQPRTVHQRVPVVMGSKTEVEEVIEAYSAQSEE